MRKEDVLRAWIVENPPEHIKFILAPAELTKVLTTIRSRTVLGRFLEHSRVFAFCNDGEPLVYIGSADMMHRNLDRRVETLVRITAPQQAEALVRLLARYVSDATSSWHLDSDGVWTRHHRDAEGRPLVDVQDHLLRSRTLGRPPPSEHR